MFSSAFGNRETILQRRNAFEMASNSTSQVTKKPRSSHAWTWLYTQSPSLGSGALDKKACIEQAKGLLSKFTRELPIMNTLFLMAFAF